MMGTGAEAVSPGRGHVRVTNRAAVLFALIAACVLAVTACSVPGGYTVAGLEKEPPARLTYPGSTEVQPRHSDGVRRNLMGRGSPPEVGMSGTTSASTADVIAFYKGILIPAGWAQIEEDPRDAIYPGRRSYTVAWAKGVLTYSIIVWTESTTTKYETNLESTA
ncbi:MAG: hypothetical protein BGO38_04780 [Cellulomonas sp. 73-145]|nr:MAG: hypothetical protein BGO38_04780 [Cellulomonas sp. 73-145]